MLDHAGLILGGILPSRRDLLLMANIQLEPEHFRNTEQRNLFVMLQRYYDATGEIMLANALEDLLTRQQLEISKVMLYVEQFHSYCAMQVPDHEFRYAIEALRDTRAHQLTGEAITTSMEILERGHEVGRVTMKGHVDSRNYLYSQLAIVDRLSGVANQAPEGDIRLDRGEILQEYADRKSGKIAAGVFTGISSIDNTTLGAQKGELIFVCAYTGEGKTTLVAQSAWKAAVDGRNVFFVSSETTRSQVRRKVLARHSRLPQFNCPDGIDSARIKNATLSENEERILMEVLDDLENNPAYGKLHIAQIPRGGTVGLIESRLNRARQSWPIDLVVIDYLALLKADRPRTNKREEYNDIIIDTKVLATTFDDGAGIPIISPWAMSQAAWKEAIKSGEYALANLAETSEAEKSADIIISLLRLPDMPSELKMQFLKDRDGAIPPPAQLDVDFKTSYIAPKAVATSAMDSMMEMD